MAKQIGSQYRETLEESGMSVVTRNGDEIILEDETGKREVWFKNDDHAGYTIEIDGVGYEFARSLDANYAAAMQATIEGTQIDGSSIWDFDDD